VLFGGLAKERPAIHPGLIGDSPKWRDVTDHPHIAATPIGRLVTMEEVADAADFLLRNTGMNAHDLYIDGGLLIR
jgi:NAD(P)-dependent dehydrogenase (short-subunit alcohol dehydrogenase family)